jgi:hypothetical protein
MRAGRAVAKLAFVDLEDQGGVQIRKMSIMKYSIQPSGKYKRVEGSSTYTE